MQRPSKNIETFSFVILFSSTHAFACLLEYFQASKLSPKRQLSIDVWYIAVVSSLGKEGPSAPFSVKQQFLHLIFSIFQSAWPGLCKMRIPEICVCLFACSADEWPMTFYLLTLLKINSRHQKQFLHCSPEVQGCTQTWAQAHVHTVFM